MEYHLPIIERPELKNLRCVNIMNEIDNKFKKQYNGKEYAKSKTLFYGKIYPKIMKLQNGSGIEDILGPFEIASMCVDNLEISPKYLIRLNKELSKILKEKEKQKPAAAPEMSAYDTVNESEDDYFQLVSQQSFENGVSCLEGI